MDNILLVEDEKTMSMIIADMLRREGYNVIEAFDGQQGLDLFRRHRPQAVIADVMMPKLDGFEMVSRIRHIDTNTPVLFLTAKSAITDLVKGFEIGANDYLKKPFSMEELLVRLKAMLRRNAVQPNSVKIGKYTFNPAHQTLKGYGQSITLTHFEALILQELALHPNEILDASKLMITVWQNDNPYNLNRLHGFIFKLRKYLAADSTVSIMNIRGIGYKLKTDNQG